MYRFVAALPLISLLSTTTAISLADFKPQIPSLPAECNTVYNFPIEECVAEDFQGDNACSDRCQNALQDLVPYVDRACRGVRVGADTIIAIFQSGNGVIRLCPNAQSLPAPLPPPPSGNPSRDPSRGPSGGSDDSLMEFAPTLGPADRSSSAFDLEGSTASPTDDDQPSRTGSGRGADVTDEASDGEDGDDDDDDGDDDGDDGGSGGGSPFDDEGGNSAAASSGPTLLCLAALFAAIGIFNVT